MEIVRKYESFIGYQREIEKYIALLNSQRELPLNNELVAITKYIIFMKEIINFTGESHYKNNLVFDILSTMHALTNNSMRQFHYVFRSFIENYARSMLNLADNDETGINDLFRKIKDRYGQSEVTVEIIDFIIGEYGNSCMFVHSNTKANVDVQLYYSEIISNDDFDIKKLRSTINKILITLKRMSELLIFSHPQIIENAFYRRKQHIRFLIGHKLYAILLEQLRLTDN